MPDLNKPYVSKRLIKRMMRKRLRPLVSLNHTKAMWYEWIRIHYINKWRSASGQ